MAGHVCNGWARHKSFIRDHHAPAWQGCQGSPRPGVYAAGWAQQAAHAHAEAMHAYRLNRARAEGLCVIYGCTS